MAKVNVKLKHVCNAPEHPGTPGDIVAVEKELAELWETNGGGMIVSDDAKLVSEAKPAEPARA